jgi:hypothetical protein
VVVVMVVVMVVLDLDLAGEGCDGDGAGVPSPGLQTLLDREPGDHQGRDRVGPGPEAAMIRSAVFSRASGSGAANCQATAAAERTSTIESRPKPISAAEDATLPAARAIAAPMRLW